MASASLSSRGRQPRASHHAMTSAFFARPLPITSRRTVGAAEAKTLGMVDRIETFDATIERLLSSTRAQAPRNRSLRAEHELALLEAEHATD